MMCKLYVALKNKPIGCFPSGLFLRSFATYVITDVDHVSDGLFPGSTIIMGSAVGYHGLTQNALEKGPIGSAIPAVKVLLGDPCRRTSLSVSSAYPYFCFQVFSDNVVRIVIHLSLGPGLKS